MRIAIFTDIHGNREGLEACLAHARRVGVDRLVFLGDLVGYGADPNAVIDLVGREMARGAIAIKGNHDAAAVARDDDMTENAAIAMAWTRKQLDTRATSFLADLPMQATDADGAVLYVHASARAPERWPYILDKMAATACLKATPAKLVFVGHTHQPAMFHQIGDRAAEFFLPHANKPVPLSSLRRWVTVVGSAGQPRDGNPAAAWGLVDLKAMSYTQHRTPYDIDTAMKKIVAAGLPNWLGQRLHLGK